MSTTDRKTRISGKGESRKNRKGGRAKTEGRGSTSLKIYQLWVGKNTIEIRKENNGRGGDSVSEKVKTPSGRGQMGKLPCSNAEFGTTCHEIPWSEKEKGEAIMVRGINLLSWGTREGGGLEAGGTCGWETQNDQSFAQTRQSPRQEGNVDSQIQEKIPK